MEYQIFRGDVIEVLKDIPDETYTCILTDPPYGLGAMPDMAELLTYWLSGEEYNTGPGFMGKNWDVVPGPAVWREVYRVCKPGAVLMAFGGTRTEDLLSMAIRLAGWERFDRIEYLYGSGFPKGHDISAAIDKEAGVERTEGEREWTGGQRAAGVMGKNLGTQTRIIYDAPATDMAQVWDGYNIALKPAHESILLFRKPRTKTYAQHAVEDGTGALNIDECIVPITDGATMARNNKPGSNGWKNSSGGPNGAALNGEPSGRWPANIIHDGSDEVAEVFARAGERTSGARKGPNPNATTALADAYAGGWKQTGSACEGSTGTAARFFQVCPQDHPDAARFFYASKASRRERNAGLEGMEERAVGEKEGRNHSLNSKSRIENGVVTGPKADSSKTKNHHPCIKPLSLCEYLSRLILPPEPYREDARLLVPFCGSGSEMVGALLAGWLNIDGIDKDEDEHGNPLGYVEIARRRLDWWHMMKRQTRLSDPAEILARVYPQDVEEANDDPTFDDLPLFAELS